jgi:hypothetical protein
VHQKNLCLLSLFCFGNACTQLPNRPSPQSDAQVALDARFDASPQRPDSSQNQRDAETTLPDSSTPRIDAGENNFDAGAIDRDAGEVTIDAGQTAYDSGSTSAGGDAQSPFFDGSLPSFDGSLPMFDGSIPPLPDRGSTGQTTVALAAVDPITVFMNLMPIVAPDPVRVQVKLDFNNAGNSSEMLSIVSATIIIAIPPMPPPAMPIPPFFQNFRMQPVHSAPPGFSSKIFNKVLGSGVPVTVNRPQDFCNEDAFVTVEISNQQSFFAQATISCVY